MNHSNWDRWGAATGYLVFALGLAAASFERGSPPANAPFAETVAYFSTYRAELLAQSVLFVLSAGVYLWFFGSVRSFLLRFEGEPGRLSTVAFGAGIVWAAMQMVFQGGQVALAMATTGEVDAPLFGMLGDFIYALSVIAYVPMAVMLAAVATVSLRTRALPAWLSWLSLLAALTNVSLSFGIAAQSGPLVPGGWLTYVLYALTALWLLAITTVIVRRLGQPMARTPTAASQAHISG